MYQWWIQHFERGGGGGGGYDITKADLRVMNSGGGEAMV